jgi:hypothetical protein
MKNFINESTVAIPEQYVISPLQYATSPLQYKTIPIQQYENRAEEKIRSYSGYTEGWCYGQGSPPLDSVVKQAIELLHTAQTYSFFVDSMLGVEGEIQLVVYHDKDRLEFTITENSGIEFLHERINRQPGTHLPNESLEEISYENSVMLDDAIKKINHFGRVIWSNTSYLSRGNIYTSMSMRKDPVVWLSRTPQTVPVSRVYLSVA